MKINYGKRYDMMVVCVWCIGCLLLAGCSSDRNRQVSEGTVRPTATSLAFFDVPPSPERTLLSTSVPQASTTPLTTSAVPTALSDTPQSVYQIFLPGIFNAVESAPVGDHSELDLTAVPTQDEKIAQIVVYDDTLDPNWSTQQSVGIDLNMAATEYVYNGTLAAAITPQVQYGQFFLTVRDDTTVAYTYDKILGVSFYLSGGAGIIENDDLAVTVLGSNAFTYWVPNDTSVQVEREMTEDLPLFSETRLYFLDINQSIPPGTWTEVIVWLDDLEFDPIYQYITGIYVKNGEDFLQTYYIDRVSLLLDQSEGAQ